MKVRRKVAEDFDRAYEKADVIVVPTSPTVAFPIGAKADNPLEMYLSDIYTIPTNLAGHPGMSVPFGTGAGGLPVGLQVLAPTLGERVMFRVAAALEQGGGVMSVESSDRPEVAACHGARVSTLAFASEGGHELIDGYELVVGLEVHVELATATKLFSASPNRFGDEPNTNIDPVTLGLPGALPVLNRQAVELAMRIGLALNCTIQHSRVPPQELLLPGHAEGVPDQPVRPAAEHQRLARPPERDADRRSSARTSRRTPARARTSVAPAAGSTAATTR